MIGYPFDSHLIYEDDGTPIYDRAVNSAQLRKLYRTLYSNGVLPNVDDQLVVKEKEEMIVEVSAGFCIAHGVLKWFDEPTNISIPQSQDQDRIDTIVVRMDDTKDVRSCELYVLKGVKSNNPKRPELTRTDTIWELGIADIFVPKNSYVVTQDRITDTRPEMERCGFISPLGEFDTDFLYEQIQGDLKYFKEVREVEFDAWFQKIRGQLSEDAAGHLQNQIDLVMPLVDDVYGEEGILKILEKLARDVLKVRMLPLSFDKKINDWLDMTYDTGLGITYLGLSTSKDFLFGYYDSEKVSNKLEIQKLKWAGRINYQAGGTYDSWFGINTKLKTKQLPNGDEKSVFMLSCALDGNPLNIQDGFLHALGLCDAYFWYLSDSNLTQKTLEYKDCVLYVYLESGVTYFCVDNIPPYTNLQMHAKKSESRYAEFRVEAENITCYL